MRENAFKSLEIWGQRTTILVLRKIQFKHLMNLERIEDESNNESLSSDRSFSLLDDFADKVYGF